MDECRKQFEELMSKPPYEMDLDRHTDAGSWPGNYRSYPVQLAWCAWEILWNRRAMLAIPEGWKLVPVEPTREMLDWAHSDLIRDGDIDPMLKSVYRAMLESAPQPVAVQEPVVTNEMAMAFCRALSDASVSQSELEEVKRGLRNALHDYAAPQQPAIDRDAFSEWFRQNMPAGTVIGDPEWWIPRILRALKSKAPA